LFSIVLHQLPKSSFIRKITLVSLNLLSAKIQPAKTEKPQKNIVPPEIFSEKKTRKIREKFHVIWGKSLFDFPLFADPSRFWRE
jgi:hypothetical protein